MDQFTYYKIVRLVTDHGRFTREPLSLCDPSINVQYEPGQWTVAKLGGLLVYGVPTGFELPASRPSGCEIWRVDVGESIPLPPKRVNVLSLTGSGLVAALRVWSGPSSIDNMSPVLLDDWPLYTRAFRRIKLMDLVDSWSIAREHR